MLKITTADSPSRKSRLETYLYDKSAEAAIPLARNLLRDDHPLCSSGVLIPVAAHQEAGRIAHSMHEYAAQEGAEPFSVILLLNYPADRGYDSIAETIHEVELAKERHPELDIRYTSRFYEEPIIGQIRKDLWDATMYLAIHDGIYDTPTGEFIAVNHDIDTEQIGRHYMRNIQKHYADSQNKFTKWGFTSDPLEPRATQVKHFYPFDTHPNIARATLWADFKYRQYSKDGCYEEGIVMPLSFYAAHGGFDPTARTYETHRPVKHLPELLGIAGTPMNTSPRRYIERFGKAGYDQLWTDETFTANDACRESLDTPDITRDELEAHIIDGFEYDLDMICRRIYSDQIQKLISRRADESQNSYALSHDELYTKVEDLIRPRLRLASNVLSRFIKSPALASIASDAHVLAQLTDIYVSAIEDEVERRKGS